MRSWRQLWLKLACLETVPDSAGEPAFDDKRSCSGKMDASQDTRPVKKHSGPAGITTIGSREEADANRHDWDR